LYALGSGVERGIIGFFDLPYHGAKIDGFKGFL